VGQFLEALRPSSHRSDLVFRIRASARASYEENYGEQAMRVNDAVDIADYLFVDADQQATNESVKEGASLSLVLSANEIHNVKVVSRKSGFRLRLEINGVELPASITDGKSGLQVKLRLRESVASASIAVVTISRDELMNLLREIREENSLPEHASLDIVGFLRHMADILLQNHVKVPGKIKLALGHSYDEEDFVGVYSIEDIRENNPGLFYEAVHHELLNKTEGLGLDEQLLQLIGQTMLKSLRPESSWTVAENRD
jgi:hypothetical protein